MHTTPSKAPRIFIGDTGRSGTSILYSVLGCHEAIHSFPTEMRFLVDPDGLRTLVDSLSVHYSPTLARETFFRFERLMRLYLTIPERRPYQNFDIANWLGQDYYWQRLDYFCSEILSVEFPGSSWTLEPQYEGRLVNWSRRLQALYRRVQGESPLPLRLTASRSQLRVPRYFADRSHLVSITADFIDDLFMHAAHEQGKETWCEKTPHNLLYLPFLWELLPESVFIHIKRDPRGVVHSLTKQRWAPGDVENASRLLRDIYVRWDNVKSGLDLCQSRYLEVKLEDFAASPPPVLEKVTSFCGLSNRFTSMPEIQLEKVVHWQEKLSRQQVELINSILGDYIEKWGYQT